MSKHLELRLGAVNTFLGSLFQCSTTFWQKNLFLIFNLNLPWYNFRPSPWVLSLVTMKTLLKVIPYKNGIISSLFSPRNKFLNSGRVCKHRLSYKITACTLHDWTWFSMLDLSGTGNPVNKKNLVSQHQTELRCV